MIIVGNIYAGLEQGGGGSVTGADSGTGLISGVVYLGINPLLQDTVIDFDGFAYTEQDLSGTSVRTTEMLNNANTAGTIITQQAGGIGLRAIPSVGLAKSITLNVIAGSGIVVDDTADNIGLIGGVLFPISDPLQYAQYGNLVSKSAGFFGESLTADTSLVSFNTDSVAAAAYRVSCALYAAIVAGSANISVSYTGFDNVARTVDLAAAIVVTGDAPNPSLTLLCAPNTALSVLLVVTGTVNCQCAGAIEFVNALS